jgi:hypothetical protein
MIDHANHSPTGETEPPAAQRKAPWPKFEIDKRHLWITTPLLIAFLGALGTAVAAFMQQHSSTLLERNKFEYTLIQKALAAPSQPDAAKELLFFRKIGLLRGLNEDEIGKASTGQSNVQELPVFHGAALRDKMISVSQTKAVLKLLTAGNNLKDPKGPNFYDGPIDDKFDLNFQIAIMKFQKEMKLDIDGLIGAKTVLSMWEACPTCPDLLQENEPVDSADHLAK